MARYRIDPSRSRVFIDARSSLHPIHTETNGLEGWLEMNVRGGQVDVAEPPRGHVEFPVDKLKSGNVLEDKELQRRIDSRRFPTITGDIELMSENGTPGTYVVSGMLTFRGVTQRYEDRVTATMPDTSTLAIAGQSVFDIRDFGMEPPRILMFKVDPHVTVRIDVIAERAPTMEGVLDMCLGIPGQLVEMMPDNPHLARVDVSGVGRMINIGLLEDEALEPGDWVLIHVGFAMSKIDEEEARIALSSLKMMGSAYTDEIEALVSSRIETNTGTSGGG